jgi:uncharacterized membrane protein YjgN (DUF898 family)
MNANLNPMAASAPASRELPLEFKATGGEYFRIWIVNLLLTIVTLGIYSAWAKVRRQRYFYGSTSLDGSSFEYHGRPFAILKGRLIVIGVYLLFVLGGRANPLLGFVLIPVIIFGVPWVVMRSRLFQMRMSSWRGLRFNFHGNYGGALGAFIGWPILGSITLGILYPMALWKQASYLLSNNAFGTQRFSFTTTVGRYYVFCLIGLGILIAALIVMGVMVAATMGSSAGLLRGLRPGASPQEVAAVLLSGGFLLVILTYGITLLLLAAWFRVSVVNAAIGGVGIGPHQLYSRLKVLPMFGIQVTNLLAMMVTLGLFYPWARVRALRYQMANTGVIASGDLNQFVADSNAGASATGDAASDFFDLDFGF